MLALAFACWATKGTDAQLLVFYAAELAFTFWFAYRLPWHGFNRAGDYSYGMYLWGFPIQQMVAHHLPDISPIANAAISVPVAVIFGALSWYLIEKPALSLKSAPGDLWERHFTQRKLAPDTAGSPGI